MTSEMPVVSVVLPVLNGARTLSPALESILNQTFHEFEVIVIDDGSTDTTPAMLDDVRRADGRIRVHRNEETIGLPRSLNLGIDHARGSLIARMDCDDISAPERLERQMACLKANDDVGLLGTQARVVNERGAPLPRWTPLLPMCHDLLVWRLLETTPFVHPSIMMRKEIVRAAGGYDPAFAKGQDMELWTRLAFTTRFANLDDVLVDYRVEEAGYAARIAAMAPRIQHVAHRYAERILERPVEPNLLRVLFDFQHRRGTERWTAEVLIDTSLLLVDLFQAMNDKGMLQQCESGAAYELMNQQVQGLVAAAQA
jgi:glycosyltransferase involved in cell wall biosynthesis